MNLVFLVAAGCVSAPAPPQFARPSADVTDGAWAKSTGGQADMFTMIDEVEASDADYIESEVAPANSPVVLKLSNTEDPEIVYEDPEAPTGYTIRARMQRNAASGAQIDAAIELRQGYISEESQGGLIYSLPVDNLVEVWQSYVSELSTEEVPLITDYSDLYVRIVANQSTVDTDRALRVSFFELEIPG